MYEALQLMLIIQITGACVGRKFTPRCYTCLHFHWYNGQPWLSNHLEEEFGPICEKKTALMAIYYGRIMIQSIQTTLRRSGLSNMESTTGKLLQNPRYVKFAVYRKHFPRKRPQLPHTGNWKLTPISPLDILIHLL